MADPDKLDSNELGEIDDLNTTKQAEVAEDADVVSHAAGGGTDAAEADFAEVNDVSAKCAEEDVKDVATKGSGEDGESEEAPAKGKRGKKRTSRKDTTKGSSKKNGSSEEETMEKGSKACRKQKELSAESSKEGSEKSSGNPEKGMERSTEKKATEGKTSSKEYKPARVKGLQSPKWWAPSLVTLVTIDLVIVVTTYIFGGNFPAKGLGNGNLFIGSGFILTGLLMTMRWK